MLKADVHEQLDYVSTPPLGTERLPDSLAPIVHSVASFHAFNLTWFGIFALTVAVTLNWRNRVSGYLANLVVVGADDIGLLVFLILPGHLSFAEAGLGPLLYLLAALFSTIGILHKQRENRQTSQNEEAVRRVIRRINELWLSKRYEEIGELLSENAIIAPLGSEKRIRGREAYVQSYRDYDQAAKTHELSPCEPQIDLVGDVAVAVSPFHIVYELDGETYRENGRDLLVLARSEGEWRVVWRTMHTEPAEQGTG